MSARWIAGIDEAGRGPLAGPVVAAAVLLREGTRLPGVADSKQLTPQKREAAMRVILERAAAVGLGIAEPDAVDAWNVLGATLRTMAAAYRSLERRADLVLVDGNRLPPLPVPALAVVGGDRKHGEGERGIGRRQGCARCAHAPLRRGVPWVRFRGPQGLSDASSPAGPCGIGSVPDPPPIVPSRGATVAPARWRKVASRGGRPGRSGCRVPGPPEAPKAKR